MRRTAAARVSKFRFSILNKYTYRRAADHAKRWAQRAFLGRLDSGGLSLLRIKQASVACSQMALHLNAPSLSPIALQRTQSSDSKFCGGAAAAKSICVLMRRINRMNLTRRTSSPKAGMGVGQNGSCKAAKLQASAPGTNAKSICRTASCSSFDPTTQDGLHIPSRCGQGGRSQEEDRRREHQYRESAPCRSGFGDVAIGEEV